jgi:transcriptional regulator with XRE-family HTH domain
MNSFSAENFSKNLKESREERGQTVRDFAFDVDLDPSIVSRLENQKRGPSFYTFCKICAVLEKTPNEMLEGNKYF